MIGKINGLRWIQKSLDGGICCNDPLFGICPLFGIYNPEPGYHGFEIQLIASRNCKNFEKREFSIEGQIKQQPVTLSYSYTKGPLNMGLSVHSITTKYDTTPLPLP